MLQQRPDNKRLPHPQVIPAIHHFSVARKLGFKSVTITCWCGESLELAKDVTKQANAFMETHQDCKPKGVQHVR